MWSTTSPVSAWPTTSHAASTTMGWSPPRTPRRRAWGAGLRALRPRTGVQPLRRCRRVRVQRDRDRVHRSGCPLARRLDREPHGRLRDEYLNRQLFTSLLEARVLLVAWRIDYNETRPPQRPRPANLSRVHPRLDHHQPAAARIAGGPSTGDRSLFRPHSRPVAAGQQPRLRCKRSVL